MIKYAAIPGLPDRSDYGDLSRLRPDEIYTLVRQDHRAQAAGRHEDLRIGDPGGLQSWAVPKFLPEVENVKRLAIQQPLHTWSYKDFQGRLKHGYGKGLVTKLEESPVVMLKNTGDHLMFTRGDTKDAPIYSMIRTKNGAWLLSIKRKDQPPEIRSYSKEHFKSIPVDKVPELVANGATVVPKIDGAGALAVLGKDGVRVFGINSNKAGDKPEYTDLIGGLRGIGVPEDLRGTVLRGEVFGQRNGRSIPPQELSGILNSTTRNALYKRKGDGIKLLMAGLALNRNGVDEYDQQRVSDIISRLNSDKLALMPSYGGDKALELLRRIGAGQSPLTSEGVVVHQPGQRPVKAKFTDDSDVVIRDIFPADTKSDSRAGGFSYSLPGSAKVVGNVGTGFSHALLREMLANPGAFIGRTARIKSQGQYGSGAYRAPSFIAMKED